MQGRKIVTGVCSIYLLCAYSAVELISDIYTVWERPNFFTSPAIARSLDEGLRASGLRVEDIDLFDFYS